MSYKNDNLLNEYVDLLPLARNRTVRKHQFLFDAALDKISDTRNAIVDKMDKGDSTPKIVHTSPLPAEKETVLVHVPVMLNYDEQEKLRVVENGRRPNKISVIASVRNRTNIGLLQAKLFVEHCMDLMGDY